MLLLSSGVRPAFVGPILLACGACGLIGLWWVGRNLDRSPRRTAAVALGGVIVAVVALGISWPTLIAVLAATALWSGAFGGIPSIYQATAVRTHALPPEQAGAWVNATANVGIAGGAAIGAVLLQHRGSHVAALGGRGPGRAGTRGGADSAKSVPPERLTPQPAALGFSGGQRPWSSTASSKCHISLA